MGIWKMRTIDLRNKKGVSPIIATLLLIVIAVAAAVVTYSFVMGFIGGVGPAGGGQAAFVVDSYSVNPSVNATVYIRNTGTKTVTLAAVYINGTPVTAITETTPGPGSPDAWKPATVTTFTFPSSKLNTGSNTVKLVFSDNTPFEFNLVK